MLCFKGYTCACRSPDSETFTIQWQKNHTCLVDLRVVFISEHDFYVEAVLISTFVLANNLFVCENKTKVQIHHDIVNKYIFNPKYHTERNVSLTKTARLTFKMGS